MTGPSSFTSLILILLATVIGGSCLVFSSFMWLNRTQDLGCSVIGATFITIWYAGISILASTFYAGMWVATH